MTSDLIPQGGQVSPPADQEKEPQEPTYEELLAKITHPKQRAFLENYPTFMITKDTAEAIGVHEFTPYDWQTNDENYLLAFLALKKNIDNTRLQKYEKELEKRALGGESKHSDILLMFGLKAESPDKYRDKMTAIPFTGSIKVELSVPRPGDQVPEIKAQAPKQLKEDDRDGVSR